MQVQNIVTRCLSLNVTAMIRTRAEKRSEGTLFVSLLEAAAVHKASVT